MSKDYIARSLFLDSPADLVAGSQSQLWGGWFPLSPRVFVYVSFVLDFILLYGLSAALNRNIFVSVSIFHDAPLLQLVMALFLLMLFNVAYLHRVEVLGNFDKFLEKFRKAWSFALLVVVAVDVVLFMKAPPETHRSIIFYGAWIVVWFVSGWLMFVATRFMLARSFKYCVEQELISHNVVIVGATELAGKLIERARSDGLGVRVRAIFEDEPDRYTPRMIADVPVKGNIADLLLYNKANDIDTVVIALPLYNNEAIQSLVQKLTVQPLRVAMLPGAMALEMSRGWCSPAGELPGIHLLSIRDLPIERSGLVIKGCFDKIVACFAILLFGPLMLICVAGIKMTSPGPVLFLQKRIGYRSREFYVFKFRSMHVAACNTGKLTERNDPRIFAFGQVMRKLSLDELPQLFNVLKGDMSLVGPRPHMPEALAAGQLYFDAVPDYAARHRVKPGITGWAQVNGWRGPTDTLHQLENRVMHDLYYIDNWSFTLDVKILVKTIFVGFFGKNAY